MLGSGLEARDMFVPRDAISSPEPMPEQRERVENFGAQSDPARIVAALRAVAFPTQLFAHAAGNLPPGFGLEEVFGTIPAPRPLPRVGGTLIAVVGSEERALAHARRIAEEVGLAPTEVALAKTTNGEPAVGRHSRRVRKADTTEMEELDGLNGYTLPPDLFVESPEQAAALSPGWRRDRVGVVAVEIGTTLDTSPRARSMLRALRPTVTLVIADATQKSADIVFRADALGGADALLLDNLHATMTPAEVLATHLPIACLGGEPATPAAWVRVVEATIARRAAGEES
jgi:hypothetical protein